MASGTEPLRTHRSAVRAAVVGALLVAGLAAASAQAAPGDFGVFSTRCTYSHTNDDDPILFPGQQDAAHEHDYTGNPTADYATTTGSLQAATSTTCDRPEDGAAYWFPALYNGTEKIIPYDFHLYYRNTGVVGKRNKATIQTIPEGLRMVAGGPDFPDQPAGSVTQTTAWTCSPLTGVESDTIPATCGPHRNGPANDLIATVTFPSCWNGTDLFLPGNAHMLYAWQNPAGRVCPASHPVSLPELTEHIRYQPMTEDLSGLRLVSDDPSLPGGHSLHADFWNAWRPAKLAELVDVCLNGGRRCGTIGQNIDPTLP